MDVVTLGVLFLQRRLRVPKISTIVVTGRVSVVGLVHTPLEVVSDTSLNARIEAELPRVAVFLLAVWKTIEDVTFVSLLQRSLHVSRGSASDGVRVEDGRSTCS